MKVLVLKQPDSPPVIDDRPLESLSPGHARVKIHAAALNRRDIWIMRGKYPGIRHPIVLGSDGCGTVEAVSGGGSAWVSRRVVFYPAFDWGDNPAVQGPEFTILGLPRDGTFAEYIDMPTENLRPAPSHLSDEEAAALPLAGLTAWRALMTRGRLQAGESVFISGIGGGVSQMAALIALSAGARVVVSSHSPDKIQRAVDMGALGGVNYSDENWAKQAYGIAGGGFDVIIDGAGGEGFGQLASLLNPAGRIVYYGGTRGKWPAILPQKLFYRQVDILASTMGSPAEMDAMLNFVTTHTIHPSVAQTFSLDDGAAAFAFLEANRQYGKVVMTMNAASGPSA